MPAGNTTVVSFTVASDKPDAFSAARCGTWTPTVSPDGLAAFSTSGATLISGANGRWLQPPIAGGGSLIP